MLRRSRHTGIILKLCLALLLLLMLFPAIVSAQGVGTLKGVIKDAETGEYLDYANILLKGTTRGTMSLGGGVFYFRGLKAGDHVVQVLYLGYAEQEVIVTISANETTEILFDMEVVIVDTIDAIAIEGAAYMVEVTSAKSEQKIGQERLSEYAVDSIEEAVSKQAGVVMRNGELYVRGGRSGEVSMRIDDVPVDNPMGGASLEVSSMAVEAVNTVTGGMDAEYGSAMSGIVNMVTRSGGDEFGGAVRYMTDDYGRQDRTYTNYDRLEFGFGGPTPVKKLTYFFSGDMNFTDTENYSVANRPEYRVNLGDATLFQFRRRQSNSVKGSTKWKYSFTESLRLTGEYSLSYGAHQGYSPNWSVSGYSRKIIQMPLVVPIRQQAGGTILLYSGVYVPVYYGPWFENMNSLSHPAIIYDNRNASLIRQVAPILEIRAVDGRMYTVVAEPGFEGFARPYSTFSTTQEDSSFVWFNSADRSGESISMNQQIKFVLSHNISDDTFYSLKLSLVSFDFLSTVNGNDPWDFNHGGIGSPNLFYGNTSLYLTSSDYYTDPLNPLVITSSDNPVYGEEYSKTYMTKFDITSSRWKGHLVKTGIQVQYNDIERRYLSSPAIERQNRFTGDYSLGANRNVFHTYNPEAAWYVQDRWEHEGMVVNYGFRWDMFSPGSAAAIELQNDDVDANVIKYKHQFSPRLGFAFPITERDGFSFHYGRFIQPPPRNRLFSSQDPIGNTGVLGNPNLKSESTVAYQAGIKHQFTDYIAGTIAIYSKDIYDLIASTTVTDEESGNTLARYINKAYASSRGVEFTLDKRYSNKFEYGLNYTYGYSDGVASSQEFGASPEGLEFLPNQELPLDWDVRHSFNFRLLLREPGSWSSSLDFSFNTGFPWTPYDGYAKKQDPLLENSMRFPATYNLSMQSTRNVDIYGQKLLITMQARNLLNQDQILTTGGGLSPGMSNASNAGASYLTETGKYGGAYLQDANGDNYNEFIPIVDPRVFAPHRLFRVGVRWDF
jgi:outer membrane receptor protein involved in Fe transport